MLALRKEEGVPQELWHVYKILGIEAQQIGRIYKESLPSIALLKSLSMNEIVYLFWEDLNNINLFQFVPEDGD